jgi:release factor glutamine methyltransferase
VLIPRPETERLVELAIASVPQGGWVHEVGTGSGAVALAIRQERPDLRVTASDASRAALEVAAANAGRLGLEVGLEEGPELPARVLAAARRGEIDLVVANLPYVREDEWPTLQPEIRGYEPREAIVSGEDGMDAIRALVAAAPSGTQLALEHGNDQGDAVRALLEDAESRPDLSNWDRITVGRVP